MIQAGNWFAVWQTDGEVVVGDEGRGRLDVKEGL